MKRRKLQLWNIQTILYKQKWADIVEYGNNIWKCKNVFKSVPIVLCEYVKRMLRS